jgi:putative ABC transport system permease protein
MNNLLKDLAYAARTLRRNPGFAVTVIATLALGIGASTAIFSVVNAVLLRPLPYTEPDRLVHVASDMRVRKVTDFPWPTGDLGDFITQGTLFSEIAAVSTFRQPVSGDNHEPEQIRTAFVTPNAIRTLGLRVAVGRSFAADDGTPQPPPPQLPPGQQPTPAQMAAFQAALLPNVVMLSHGFWLRRYGGDSSIVGRTVGLGGGRATVVGVLAPNAELLLPPGLNVERVPDVWWCMRLNYVSGSRINVQHRVIARLKPGVTLAQAQAQVDAFDVDLRRRFPLKESVGLYHRVEPLNRDLVADVQQGLVQLMGAVIFVLLIACANVANLLLVRASRRERELVVRSALGGQRWRLVRQMLAEACVLAVAGAAAGLFLAQAGIELLKVIGPQNLPRLDDVAIDPFVLGFATLATVGSVALFGILPALRASRTDVADALRGSARTAGLQGSGTLRSLVVMAEVALCFVLLIGSGLMFRSFLALQRVDLGFDADRVLTFVARNTQAGGDTARRIFIQQFRDRLAAIPGVRAVTAANPLPLDGSLSNARWGTAEAQSDPNRFHQGNVHFVLPGYFEAMRTRLVAGRTFTEADNHPQAAVMVIDDMMARKAFGSASAVGKRLLARIRTNDAEWFDVIGVVAHARHDSLAGAGREAMFFADGLVGWGAVGRWALRVDGDPMHIVPTVRSIGRELQPLMPIAEVQPLRAFVDKAGAPTRFALVLIGVFAVIAVILAAVGLYGVLSSLVRQRTAEIGVRMALGAPRESIFQLVVSHGMRLSVIGIVVGLAGALALTRGMSTMLVGVRPTDPLTFAAIVGLFLAIAFAACWFPARRAAGLEPTIALREE